MNGLQHKVKRQLGRHRRITTQVELAQYLEMSASSLSRLLNNPNRQMTQNTFDKLQSFLGISVGELDALLETDALTDEELREKQTELEERMRNQSWMLRDLAQRLSDAEDIIEDLRSVRLGAKKDA